MNIELNPVLIKSMLDLYKQFSAFMIWEILKKTVS